MKNSIILVHRLTPRSLPLAASIRRALLLPRAGK